MNVDELEATWRARSSRRAYLPEPIDPATLTRVFELGQTAPSWCNVQPWRVVVTTPPRTQAIAAALQAAATAGMIKPEIPFPLDYPDPYKQRRVDCGVTLYKAMNIARDDKASRYGAWLRNYALFDAPHVAIVACDRRLGPYAYLDVGVWLGYVLTACAAVGIDTCPMASIAAYPDTLRANLLIGDHEIILFGMVLGHADATSPTNRCRTTREPLETNVTFVT